MKAADSQTLPQNAGTNSVQVLFLVCFCFFLSGLAALVYQAAWLKKIAVIFGTSHIAVATVLAAYMAGLALGAAFAGRWVNRIKRPVLVYGVLEAIIGIAALCVPLLFGLAQYLLVGLFGHQASPVSDSFAGQTLFYLASTFVILVIPTAAMGATLPLLARFVVRQERYVGPRVGLLYGLNTIGAVGGALIAGFILLPYWGLWVTLMVGTAVNLIVFLLAVVISRMSASMVSETSDENLDKGTEKPQVNFLKFHWVMPVMLFSGVVSFTLEVLWTRMLSHVFGGTVYAFSIMLACFLSGIALGGFFAGQMATDRQKAGWMLVLAQLAIAFVSLESFLWMEADIPEFRSSLDVRAIYAFFVIVPATIFIGATYPLAVRVSAPDAETAAGYSGLIYSWNTFGAIVGSLLAGFYLLPAFGYEGTLRVAMMISCSLAVFVAFKTLWQRRVLLPVSLVSLLAVMFLIFPSRPDSLIFAHVPLKGEKATERYYSVGKTATIMMHELDGFSILTSNGLSESSVGRKGMPPFNLSQKWLSGLPVLARPDAQSAMIIGFGGGVALEGIPQGIRDVDIVEIEQEVINANRAVAQDRGIDLLSDPRLNLVINDARNALLLTDKQYDIIVSQPSHPWTGGASHLYTSEFLSLAKKRLKKDGVFLQWINSQFVDEDLLKTLMMTIANQFEYVELYQPERQVLLFLASDAPLELVGGAEGAAKALEKYPHHFKRMGMLAREDALWMRILDDGGIRRFARGAVANTDNHNRLAFFSRATSDGLNANDMTRLFADLDPLLPLHQDPSVDMAYIVERLLQANFKQRVSLLANKLDHKPTANALHALGYHHSNEDDKAEQFLIRSINEEPTYKPAQMALLRLYMGELAQGKLPPDIAKLANAQSGPERRVLEGWFFGARGLFDNLQELDPELAQVPSVSLFYPIAVKLRADWRLVKSKQENRPDLAAEALELLDDLLASFWSQDLYFLRAACALQAGDDYRFTESLWAVSNQIKERLQSDQQNQQVMDPGEAAFLKSRLSGLEAQLQAVDQQNPRDRNKVVARKLMNILAQIP